MSIDLEYMSHDIIDSYVSVQGNTAILTREYMFRLKEDYRGAPNAFSTEMDVLSCSKIYQDNEILTKNTEDFYPNINFYVTSRSAKAMFKSSSSGEAMDERIWKVTIVFTGEGLNFQHLSTETVKIIDVETGIAPYNYNVTKAYNHPSTGQNPPIVKDISGNPKRPVENTVKDPLLEGLVEVRNIEYIKITADYIGLKTFNKEWINMFSNTLNEKAITVYGKEILPFCGMITVEGYKYLQIPPNDAKTRVTLHVQVKQTVNSIGGWIQQPLNQGYRHYKTAADVTAKNKTDITNADIKESGSGTTTSKSPDARVSDPMKLAENGMLLGKDATPYFLQFIVQPFCPWTVLCLPEGQ